MVHPRLGFAAYFWMALLLTACHDSAQSPPARPEPPEADADLAPVDLVYVCGNKFLVTNGTRSPVQVEYRVAETSETGGLTLEEGPGGDPGYSETELETSHTGVVELYQDNVKVASHRNEGLPCGASPASLAIAATGSEETVGKWSAPLSWPVIAVHLNLLPNGKVLFWGEVGEPYVWDPAANSFTMVPVATELFCSGHAFLPDGRLLVNGGHVDDGVGVPDANIFQRTSFSWSTGQKMAKGRWYPSTITLANGEMLTLSGSEVPGTMVRTPEVWTGSGWRALTGAGRNIRYYPRIFLAPNGRVFHAGENQATYYLSTTGSGAWSSVGLRLYGTRDYGAAVMYEPGKVLYAGGGRTTNTAEIIDLNRGSPAWLWTGSMNFARRHHNATILPTGEVLVTGGTAGTAHTDESKAVYAAELWNPTTGNWTLLASGSVIRGYHSTAVLLRDGRVLVTGSGDSEERATDQLSAELYSPPYLFKGARPVISSYTGTLGYGQTTFVGTNQASSITGVILVRLGSTTHAFNSNQRFNRLSFAMAAGGLNVTTPANRNLAPPGHYLLFLLNGKGVPSVGKVVRLR